MKAIAIGDCHIKMVPGVNKNWQRERYYRLFSEIVSKCASENAILIIAGDTLDSTVLKKDEVSLFLEFMHMLNDFDVTVLIVSGNHCTLKEGSSILDFLRIDQFDNVHYRYPPMIDGIVFHLVNHDSIHSYSPHIAEAPYKNVLVSHFRCNYSEFVREEVDVKKLIDPYDLCIVGDIHAPFEDGKLVYTNNPINKEFEANPNCGYLEIDLEDLSYKRIKTNYPSLRSLKVKAEEFSSIKLNTEDFYRIEVEAAPEELREIPNSLVNAIVVKIPIIASVLNVETAQEMEESLSTIDEQLEVHVKSLSYPDEEVSEMMLELRRKDD